MVVKPEGYTGKPDLIALVRMISFGHLSCRKISFASCWCAIFLLWRKEFCFIAHAAIRKERILSKGWYVFFNGNITDSYCSTTSRYYKICRIPNVDLAQSLLWTETLGTSQSAGTSVKLSCRVLRLETIRHVRKWILAWNGQLFGRNERKHSGKYYYFPVANQSGYS